MKYIIVKNYYDFDEDVEPNCTEVIKKLFGSIAAASEYIKSVLIPKEIEELNEDYDEPLEDELEINLETFVLNYDNLSFAWQIIALEEA